MFFIYISMVFLNNPHLLPLLCLIMILRVMKIINLLWLHLSTNSKAFDSLNHKNLLSNLEGYEVYKVQLDWLKSYFSDLVQYTETNGVNYSGLWFLMFSRVESLRLIRSFLIRININSRKCR